MNDAEGEKAKEGLREQLRARHYELWVFSTFRGHNWDNTQSKNFILALPVYDEYYGHWRIWQLTPYYLKSLGFDWFFKEAAARVDCFYDGVFGMSRAFNIVYGLSSWLFKDTPDAATAHNGSAGYVLTQR